MATIDVSRADRCIYRCPSCDAYFEAAEPEILLDTAYVHARTSHHQLKPDHTAVEFDPWLRCERRL